MAFSLSCLDGLVGLDNRECPCINEGKDAYDNESRSGYFLTDPEYGFPLLNSLFSGNPCGDGDIWATLDDMRSMAVRDFVSDLRTALYDNTQSRFNIFSGHVGERKYGGVMTDTTKAFRGVVLNPKKVRGASLRLRAISLHLDCATTVTVTIYKEGQTEEVDSYTFATVANTQTEYALPSDLVLPVDGYKYAVVWSSEDACRPYRNKLTCCGRRKGWQHYMGVASLNSDTNFRTSGTTYANGLSLDVHISCDSLEWMCDLDTIEEYTANSVIGSAITMKAAVKTISYVLDSGMINSYTLLSSDKLYAKRNGLAQAYQNQVNWIAQNVPASVSDCTKCKENTRVGSILI